MRHDCNLVLVFCSQTSCDCREVLRPAYVYAVVMTRGVHIESDC